MKEHHLQLNPAKTELLVFPANPIVEHNITVQLGPTTVSPSKTVRNLGVTIDDELNFTDHISKTARSCRFTLYNIRKIRPFLSVHATQLLVQSLVITRLDYCNALIAGLPACAIRPLQMIQNAAARLVFNEPKRAHVTPLFVSLHWLPVHARIKFKALMLAYKTVTGSAPAYLKTFMQSYVPTRSLRSAKERRLVVPKQRGTKTLSRTFSFIIPRWWNDLSNSIREANSLSIFKKRLKTHLFQKHLTGQ
ncbi:uncharacterized protein LOC127656077 isoform X1 [Xyrauchen texanus]|uniref:uncharacterized protein LOC127656077 isoform X1 n=1 Tax=Xyrauchen texanus TaxID=154827 RepID=UPI0022428350|nr:uncharacterized protein LOC127656077 isoform X1 [Xyrauchen texanus]